MRIAVEGCAHGELEIIYNALEEIEKNEGKKIDLLICCGDFQSTRNLDDLNSMAVPDKFKDMCTFYKLRQLTGNIDIFLSHDWPNGVTKFGDEQALLRRKKHFKDDIAADQLGSPPSMDLLTQHHPKYWFSAHLHCKFAAIIPNEDNSRSTKFLALDKCLAKRPFLQVLDIPHDENASMDLSYDLEWLAILYLTNHLLSVKNSIQYMPGPKCRGRWNFSPSESEKESVLKRFSGCLKITENFERTVEAYVPGSPVKYAKRSNEKFKTNKQTTDFCNKLEIDDPPGLLLIMQGGESKTENGEEFSQSFNSIGDEQDISASLDDDLTYESDLTFEASLNDDSGLRDEGEESGGRDCDELRDEGEGVSEVQSPIEPNLKKFKRRNLAIYADTTDIDL
ncbi:lariat debranching enzyme isoform X2 [Fopius arisanus]|uniref:Lariat debranching enzyme isoform X2 n=1 Tax=Fopius arisanus TaxID=64838 RepID=A0A9R1TMU2_9HYME|nr:PREDICTED: lariat debranching enzyme isoform X2 [Fopius arisanus]